jgi:hypothetical protein
LCPSIGRHPDIELLEASFELFFVVHKKLVIVAGARYVHEDAHHFIPKHFALVLPLAADDLRLGGDRVELLPEFQKRLANQLIRDRAGRR